MASTSSPLWAQTSSGYVTVKQGQASHRIQTAQASEDADAVRRVDAAFSPTLKNSVKRAHWSQRSGAPDLQERVVSEVIRTPRRVQGASGSGSFSTPHTTSSVGSVPQHKQLKQMDQGSVRGAVSQSTPLQAVASPCRAHRPIPPPASPPQEEVSGASEETSPLQAEGLQKTLVSAEEMDTQQVKVYVLETRTGETAVAVERADGKRWRFLRNSIDFELECSADALQQWLDGLVSEQLPGLLTLLANEVNTRGETLKAKEMERNSLRGSEDYEFFGLDGQNCTDKDIERAYRKKSTKLHPDKGGDEESFNHMREKYEQLKSLRGEKQKKEGGGSIKWDARSRESMLHAHGELREQLVWITRHINEVEDELKDLRQRQATKYSLSWEA